MHVISRKKLKEAVARHGDLEGPLDAWFRIAKKDLWRRLADVRKTFSTADALPPGRLVTQFRALPLVGRAQKVLGVHYAPTFIAELTITGTAWHLGSATRTQRFYHPAVRLLYCDIERDGIELVVCRHCS